MKSKILLCLAALAAFNATAEQRILSDVEADRADCLIAGSMVQCKAWEKADPDGFADFYDRYDPKNSYSVLEIAERWKVADEELIALLEPELLTINSVDSVGGFNPYAVDFKNADQFERNRTLSPDEKYKWLRYRREEIGVCFEDEELNEFGYCIIGD